MTETGSTSKIPILPSLAAFFKIVIFLSVRTTSLKVSAKRMITLPFLQMKTSSNGIRIKLESD